MKRYLFCYPIILVLVIGLIGCSNEQTDKSPPIDAPLMSEHEACDFVYGYFRSQIDGMTESMRIRTQQWLMEARPDFHADYVDTGRWSVKALGYVYDAQKEEWSFSSQHGLWYVYDESKIVEPGNVEARSLLTYWQQYNNLDITTGNE